MVSREETATVQDRSTGERQQYPDEKKFQPRSADDGHAARPVPGLDTFTGLAPGLEASMPFDHICSYVLDEGEPMVDRESIDELANSIRNGTYTSTSTSTISGRSTGTATSAWQRATTTSTHKTSDSTTTPPSVTPPPPPPAPGPAPPAATAATESWFHPCSESDKRAAKYLINNTASTSNKDLAALVHEAAARNDRSRGVIVKIVASLRKAALKHRRITEEDWERAVLEDDEYQVVKTASTRTVVGVRGGKRREETRERGRFLMLRPDVRVRWNGLVIDQYRVRQLPRVKAGGVGWDGEGR